MSLLEAVWWTWIGVWTAGSLGALVQCVIELVRLRRLHRRWDDERSTASE